jgi:hypothetical protein
MALNYLTSDSLIASIKRRAMLPTSNSTFQDDDFLAMANEEMNIGMVPSIIQMQQDYLLTTEVVPLTTNQSRYKIPSRAIGNKLYDVMYKDTNGNFMEMTRIEKADLPAYNGPYTIGYARMFYVENGDIVIFPDVTGTPTGSLEMSFYIRPNQLVAESRVGVISAINTSTGEITLENLPSVFNLSESYDFIEVTSPHVLLSYDLVPTSINTTTKTITFNPAQLPDDLEVGDHIALANESMIPQIPSDLHVVLAHRVATRCLEALGDTQGLQNANAKLVEMESKSNTLINNRVSSAPQKIINRSSVLRDSIARRRRSRF